MLKRYDIRTDLVFGRLLGVKRFREHAIDLLRDIDGKGVLESRRGAPYVGPASSTEPNDG